MKTPNCSYVGTQDSLDLVMEDAKRFNINISQLLGFKRTPDFKLEDNFPGFIHLGKKNKQATSYSIVTQRNEGGYAITLEEGPKHNKRIIHRFFYPRGFEHAVACHYALVSHFLREYNDAKRRSLT